MSPTNYAVTINRPLQDVVDYLTDLDTARLPQEGGLSFERVRSGTRIIYTTTMGVAAFFKLADLLIAQAARRDRGSNVPRLVFEP
jgi:hypothetical protein